MRSRQFLIKEIVITTKLLNEKRQIFISQLLLYLCIAGPNANILSIRLLIAN